MDKPFELRYIEAKDKIVNAVNSARNEYGVPFIFIDTIIQDLGRQVSANAKDEVQKVYDSYLSAVNGNTDDRKKELKAEIEETVKDEEERF